MIKYLTRALRDLGLATQEDLNSLSGILQGLEREVQELQGRQRENLSKYHPSPANPPYAPKKEK